MSRVAIESITLHSQWVGRIQDEHRTAVYTSVSVDVSVDMGRSLQLYGSTELQPDEWSQLQALITAISERIERDVHAAIPNAQRVFGAS